MPPYCLHLGSLSLENIICSRRAAPPGPKQMDRMILGTRLKISGIKQVIMPREAIITPAAISPLDLGASPKGVLPRVTICRAKMKRSSP